RRRGRRIRHLGWPIRRSRRQFSSLLQLRDQFLPRFFVPLRRLPQLRRRGRHITVDLRRQHLLAVLQVHLVGRQHQVPRGRKGRDLGVGIVVVASGYALRGGAFRRIGAL